MNSIKQSTFHTNFEEEDSEESTDSIDPDCVVAGLVEQGCGPVDIADVFRRGGWSMQRLSHALREVGFGKLDMGRAVHHFKEDCPHDGGGDVGTLPRFPDARPDLHGGDDDIRPVAQAAWRAIQVANRAPSVLQLWGAGIMGESGTQDPAAVEPMTVERMLLVMGEVASWYRITMAGRRPCRPPKPVATHLVTDPHPPLPRLNRLVSTPVFDAGGRLVARAGYHEESGLFLATRNLVVPPVAHKPTDGDICRARVSLLELVQDFPFVGEADRTNALALLMLPFVRDLISGPTPLHLVTKPTPGSGGTLLVQALLYPALGRRVESQTVPDSGSEVQRRITAALMLGPAAILFDNLRKRLDSDHVASVLTAEVWRDRQIRTSSLLQIPVTNAWVATGNNAQVSEEIARRTLPIRLDPHDERPWDRKGFRHQDLIRWTAEKREDLIWSALTLVQAWVADGMPDGSLTVGMFEDWARVLSGIFEVVGIPGLRENWLDWFEDRPSEENRTRQVVEAWQDEFGGDQVRAGQLLPVVGPLFDIPPDGSKPSQTMLGGQLKKLNGQVVDGFEIVGRDVSGSMAWRLIPRG